MKLQGMMEQLFQSHVDDGFLRYPEFLKVMSHIPIDRIFSGEQIKVLLEDKPVLIYDDKKHQRTVSAPHMISIFLSMLELSSEDKMLVLGAKGGFLESVLAAICESVYILEEHPGVGELTASNLHALEIRNARVITQNPLLGLGEKAPFSKILFTGSVESIPEHLIEQLELYGLLVAPISRGKTQQVIQFFKTRKGVETKNYGRVNFQGLYYTKGLVLTPTQEKFTENDESLQDTLSGLPLISIKDVNFENTGEKDASLNFNNASFALNIAVQNSSTKTALIKIRLEMPSVQKESNPPITIQLDPKQTITHPILFANPQKEGEHKFIVHVTNEKDLSLAHRTCEIVIKKPLMSKLGGLAKCALRVGMR